MDNRTAQRAGSSYQPTRSILKPSRSSHAQSSARQISRSPPSHPSRTVQIADPPTRAQTQTQALRSIAAIPQRGPIPEMTITFPAVHNAEQLEQLEQLALEFARQIQARRRQLESNPINEVRISSPPPTPPPPLLPAGRPSYIPDDYPEFRDILMEPWQAGADYGPIFKPHDVMKLGPLRINPLISSPPQIHWDVTQPPSTAIIIRNGRTIPFDEFRYQPATSPRITQVKTISRVMPWDWLVGSRNKAMGVTIGDLFISLSVGLGVYLSEKDMAKLSDESRDAALHTHLARCSDKEGKGPQIYDILSGSTTFGGWVYDQEYERERDFRDKDWEINILVSYLPNTT